MKKIFVTLLSCCFLSFMWVCHAEAQNNQNKRLTFFYIDHEVTTPTAKLNERARSLYTGVVQSPNAAIFYLSNGRRSPMAFVNLPEYLTPDQLSRFTTWGMPRNTEDAFNYILELMNRANSHDVDARADVDNILNILDQFQVFDENGRLNYQMLRFYFYVGPNFWLLRNNEKIIARLYSVIRQWLPDDEKGKIEFEVFRPADTPLDYPEGQPFGVANLDDINNAIIDMTY